MAEGERKRMRRRLDACVLGWLGEEEAEVKVALQRDCSKFWPDSGSHKK
jgi:hypothetical protein